jgi:hypothetical protein
MSAMKQAGYYTVMVSPFPNRHAAWHVIDGFREAYDTGKGGMEIAEEATPTLLLFTAIAVKRIIGLSILTCGILIPHTVRP